MKTKTIFVLLIPVLISFEIFGASFSSKNEKSGNWIDNNLWIGGSAPSGTINNDAITINGTISSYGNVIVNNSTITINSNDTLVVLGNLTVGNGSDVIVNSGAVLVVLGNFDTQNNLTMDISSIMIVKGSFTSQHGAGSDISMTGASSNFYIIGTNNLVNGDFVSPASLASIEDQASLSAEQPGLVSWINTNYPSYSLPITLTKFSAKKSLSGIEFYWETSSEINNYIFTIEGSYDAKNWETLGFVLGAGTSTQINTYSYQYDVSPNKIQYFRLKQTDFNGLSSYSKVISLRADSEKKPKDVIIYPTVVDDEINISNSEQIVTIKLFNRIGTLVYKDSSKESIPVQNLSNGLYIIEFELTDGDIIQKTFIKK